jgi:GNAT superfamily N-acetyltransferase
MEPVPVRPFHEEHRLHDGTVVTLRYIRADDAPELAQRFSELSLDSRRRRFFAGMAGLSARMLRYLTEVDGYDHVAIVATVEGDGHRPRGVGVARFIRLAEAPTIAEPAITIADEFQNRGLGHLLACVLARAARERGIRRFRGPILTDNLQAHRLMDSFGVHLQVGDECQQFDIDLEQPERIQELARALVRTAAPDAAR